MPRSYELDDILEEIKRKKSERESAAPAGKAQPAVWEEAVPERKPQPKAAVSAPAPVVEQEEKHSSQMMNTAPLGELADFFGNNAKYDIGAEDKKSFRVPAASRRTAVKEEPAAPAVPAAVEEAEPVKEAPARPAWNIDQDTWEYKEEPEKRYELDKTQISIPAKQEPVFEQEEDEELGKTRSIPRSKIEAFDFEKLQESLREQEEYEEEVLFTEPEEDDEYIRHAPKDDEIEDYRSAADVVPIKKDLKNSMFSLNSRLIATTVLFLFSVYLSLAQKLSLPLPAVMDPAVQPRIFMVANLALVIIAALVCSSTVGGGLASFMTFRGDSDSLAALAVIATVIQGVAIAAFPNSLQEQNLGLFFSAALFGLICNLIGKKTIVKRIWGNFEVLSAKGEKKAVLFLKNRELARELTRGTDLEPPALAYAGKSGFMTRFLELSYEPDKSEGIFRVAAPVVFVCSLVVGGASFYLRQNVFTALTAFAGTMCIASPITATLYANFPLLRAQKVLAKENAQISGFGAVDSFSTINGVTVDASELFPSDNVLLHNIKMFEKRRIDEAILDASSALCSFDGTIKNVFMKIIQGNTGMLKKVESLVYEDGMGISAWVDGKRVLIGNSALMRHHEIYTPSGDYEAKYRAGGRDLIYLANSGELTAMFVVSYQPDPGMARSLFELERKGIGLIVRSTDPNLTANKIAQVYDLPPEMVHVIPAKLHGEFDVMTGQRQTAPANISFTGGASSLFHSIAAAISVKSAINLGNLLQAVGILLGYGLMAVMILLGSMTDIGGLAVIAFQLLWGLGTMLFSNLRRI